MATSPQSFLSPGGRVDRRGNSRFPIVRDLRYRLLSSRVNPEWGVGTTLDISSSGILFAAESPLPLGRRLEISISWPAQLNGKCALKLLARGRITRSQGKEVAVQMDKYEFRTQGARGLLPQSQP